MAEGVLLVELLATGEVTQQQMADRLGLDRSRGSRLCSALEAKRLVARHTWHQRHDRMLSAMSQQERRALLLGLGALARELSAFHEGRSVGDRTGPHEPTIL